MNKKIRDHIYFAQLDVGGVQNTSNKTKVVPIDYYIENEISNVKRIKQNIVPSEHFFYIFESVEKIHIGKMDENIYHLKQVNKIKDDHSVLFTFEDKKMVYMENFLQSLTTPTKYIYILGEFFRHINRALQLLVSNKLVYNHINMKSIVVDNTETPLLCNFKFSIDITRSNNIEYLSHFFLEYQPSYLPWCPELHILSYLLSNKLESLSLFNIENIIGDCVQENYILQTFGASIVSEFKDNGISYFKKYVNKPAEFIIQDILHYWHTWDNYAFSMLYLQLLIGIHKKIKKNNKFIIFFMKLLVKNISTNPSARLSLEDTVHQFDTLLYSIIDTDKSVYTDLINSI